MKCEYRNSQYEYSLDENDRVVSAKGELRLEEGVRDLKAQLEAGGEFRRPTDDGGHLIGTRFGGFGGHDNLIAEDRNLNRSGFKTLENEWAGALENGKDVYVEIEPVYQEDVERPCVVLGGYEVTSENGETVKDYFSFTNEDLNSEEFELPREADGMLEDFSLTGSEMGESEC